jgi:pimeloyl-ACP methyl ester carboxylesterase
VAIVGITYGALTLMLFLFQHRLLYLPDLGRTYGGTPADAGMKHAAIEIPTEDGERLSAWVVDAPGADPAGHGTVLFLHGNAGSLGARVENLRVFHQLGWRTLIVSYRGYGLSTGRPDEAGTYRDATAAWRHLTATLGVPSSRIVAYGESLGGGVASWLAVNHPVAGLVTMAAFTSIPDLGQELYPFIPVRALARFRYDNRGNMAQLKVPVLIIHSQDDELVRFAHAQRLLAAAEGAGVQATLLTLRGSHDGAFRESATQYREGLARFLGSVVRPAGQAASGATVD